ncbi:transmembrane sensor [Ensifer adhaerens]|uniref:Transmembrane sensor n=1 Tax=Ensifer adhaerens TaxID=106592 RepID=A0ACC5T581_ENSAD|nr:FecR family protein [Ensifer adhaerens]MBP1876008.1 transmembrane sensor [Ensifer adhaerens]
MAEARDPSKEQPKDEALAWFVRLTSGEATAAERSAHATWMAASPSHRKEYEKLAGIWSDLDIVGDPRGQRGLPIASRSAAFGRRSFLAGGAAMLGVAGYVGLNGLPDFLLSDYETGTAELRELALADGSRVSLDADTAIAVDFIESRRSVQLLRGRAFFDVAKDARRPFIVEAGAGTTTALGTRFVVHRWSDTVTVSVEESAVSVMAPDHSSAILQVGQNVSYGETGLGDVGDVDVQSETAWRRGKLIFKDRPLRQVIADVNRYRAGTIRIVDSELDNLRVSGIFEIANPDGVLGALSAALPVRVLRLTDYLVLLRAA